MANMSYCRFENTLDDLEDCYEHMDVELLNDSEIDARKHLIKLCIDIVDNYKHEVEDD